LTTLGCSNLLHCCWHVPLINILACIYAGASAFLCFSWPSSRTLTSTSL
jgi:hypothetical protein